MRFPWQRKPEERSDIPLNINDWAQMFSFSGHQYPFGLQFSQPGEKQEVIGRDFGSLVAGAFKSCGPIFACCMVRQLIFSEARFKYRRLQSGRPGELWGDPSLRILETPWPGGTTGDLLSRMEQDVSLAGNSFTARRNATTLRRLRPDWVEIVLGSQLDPEQAAGDIDAEVIGYLYFPGGRASGRDPEVLLPSEVAHYAPIPDPDAHFRGMSWLTPVISEIMGDKAATTHKLKFFEHGATVNYAVKAHPDIKDDEEFDAYVRRLRARNEGVENAYKTFVLGGGADIVPLGADMQQIDFKVTQGAGETRIASASGVGAVIAGFSEGLAGSSLNAGNFSSARRRFADGTMRPLWRNAAGSLARIVPPPSGSELWYDDRDISFLQEDQKDKADIQQVEALTMRTLLDAGFEPESVKSAQAASDWSLLVHSGLFSVQLQPPGSGAIPAVPKP